MKFVNLLIFISLLLTLNLSAITYEDGEDKKTNRWENLTASSSSTTKNVYDKVKGSRVIQFQGEETKDAYILMINESKNKKIFHWQMKYTEDFVIFISLETKLGKRYLIYTPGNKDGYMQYGLGLEAVSGTWQRYSRNLEEDLGYFDNRNSIVKINSFVIRGSGSIDNIKIMKELKIKARNNIDETSDETSMETEEKPLKLKKKTLSNRSKTNTTPSISIEGENPFFLMLGEAFEEPGVSAEDKEDGALTVISSENINMHKEGKYAVIYMATDARGNSAIDKRYVIVGEPKEDVTEDSNENSTDTTSQAKKESTEASSSKDDQNDAEYRLEERELEIAEWERELQFREKEIDQREKSIIK